MAAGEVRNPDAIAFASSPSTTCRINGARTPPSIAGCAHANINARRRSGSFSSFVVAPRPSAITCKRLAPISRLLCPRVISIAFRRATVISHASGFEGQPFSGQSANADAKASACATLSEESIGSARDARDGYLYSQYLARSWPVGHMRGAAPLGRHHVQRSHVSTPERAREATAIEVDVLQHFTTFAHTDAALVWNVRVPDGVFRVQTNTVRYAFARVGPHSPI